MKNNLRKIPKLFDLGLIYFILGISVLTFYNVQIVEASLAPVNSNHSAVAFGVVRLVFNIAGCYLLSFCNRRTLNHRLGGGIRAGNACISDSQLYHHLGCIRCRPLAVALHPHWSVQNSL